VGKTQKTRPGKRCSLLALFIFHSNYFQFSKLPSLCLLICHRDYCQLQDSDFSATFHQASHFPTTHRPKSPRKTPSSGSPALQKRCYRVRWNSVFFLRCWCSNLSSVILPTEAFNMGCEAKQISRDSFRILRAYSAQQYQGRHQLLDVKIFSGDRKRSDVKHLPSRFRHAFNSECSMRCHRRMYPRITAE